MMLLRSSSTPVIGSLLASISAESPIGNNHFEQSKPTSILHTHTNKLPFHQTGPLNISHNSSPISPSIDFDRFSSTGFLRRAQSDGNLEGLAYAASCDKHEDDPFFCDFYHPNKLSDRSRGIKLQTIESFSTYNSGAGGDEEDSDREYDDEEVTEVEENERVMAIEGGDQVGLEDKVKSTSFSEDMKTVQKMWGNGGYEAAPREVVSQEMYLAKGLGIGGGGGGGRGGREASWEGTGGDGGVEEHYKKMVEEHPGNPLFLGNYAQFLYQTKRDLPLAEAYYSRSILADPNDGEVLAQYAKVIWELHHDQDRALSYFERAVQAAPEDSHVHAAYAGFLWETEEDYEDDENEDENEDEDEDVGKDLGVMATYIHRGIMA